MNTTTILENSIRFSLDESWQRNCTVLNDVPLSAAYWGLGEMTGEKLLDELPELEINPEQIFRALN